MANTERIPERKDVGEEFKWRLEDIYPTNSDWEADYERAKSYIEKAADFKGKISQSAKSLLDYLTMDDEISVLLDGLANYAHRRCDEDTRNAVYQAMKGKLEPLFVEMSSAAAFARPEIISIPEDKMEYFYREEKGLELYRVALTRLREMNEHILSDSEERLLAMTGEISESPDNIFSMFNDADLTFPDIEDGEGNKIQVTHGSYIPLMHNPDRNIRKAAFESMYHTYEHFRNTSAAMLSAQVKTVGFYAKARNYPSALDASLAANRVPTEVYHSLIDAVHDNMHYMYDYVRLRKKLLGVDELHMYDVYTPIVADADQAITYEQAKETVLAELRQTFRPEFLNRIDDIIVFHALTERDIEEVARRMLKTVAERMEAMGIHLDAGDEAVKELAKEGFDPKYGARPLRRYVQHTVETLLAKKIVEGNIQPGAKITVDVENGELALR